MKTNKKFTPSQLKKCIVIGMIVAILSVVAPLVIYANIYEDKYTVTFETQDRCTVAVHYIQGSETPDEENATTAYARNSATGEIDISGDGQVNFVVTPVSGYAITDLQITDGAKNYKNLKVISESDHSYRLTKITGDITVTINTELSLDNMSIRELVDKIYDKMDQVPQYYEQYYTEETASTLTSVLNEANEQELPDLDRGTLIGIYNGITNAIDNLQFKTCEIPQVYITTDSGAGNTIQKANGYIPTTATIADSESVLTARGRFKVRGNTTASAPKKPFAINFDTKQNVLGMGSAKKWVLMANCYDPTLLRNAISLEMAKQLDLAGTPDYRFVELWVDGVFKGCYLLTEAVEVGKNRVDIDTKKNEFLIQFEKVKKEPGKTYVTTRTGLRFLCDDPEEPNEEQLQNIQAVVDSFEDAIDSKDYEQVKEIVDIESMAKIYLINEYARNQDFGYSSVYFYYKEGKIYSGPLWDFDRTYGNSTKTYFATYEGIHAAVCNLYKNLFEYSEFQADVKIYYDQYKDYFESLYAEGGLIDQLIEENANAIQRNYTIAGWDVSYPYLNTTAPEDTYEGNVDFLKRWMKARFLWLDNYYDTYIDSVLMLTAEGRNNGITVTWRPVENAQCYYLNRRTEDGDWVTIASRITSCSYTDWTAQAQTKYYYKAVAEVNSVKGWKSRYGIPAFLEEKNITPLRITNQPQAVYNAIVGSNIIFSIEAQGDSLTYVWKALLPDGTTRTFSSRTPTITKSVTKNDDGWLVYCTIKDKYGNSIVSDYVPIRLAHDHTFVMESYDQDCTHDKCDRYTCIDCGYSYSENYGGYALGHYYDVTEINDGVIDYRCRHCGDEISIGADELYANWNTDMINRATERSGRNNDDLSSMYDLVKDGFINAKDYAYMKAVEKAV